MYAELALALGVEVGETAPLAAVREAVLELRRSKGMVIDPADPDSVSAGSFFTNPILEPDAFERLERRVAERLGPDVRAPRFPEPDGRVKTSAAWLVERAGFGRGHGAPGPIMVSTKHSLALTNRGGGTTLAARIARARPLRTPSTSSSAWSSCRSRCSSATVGATREGFVRHSGLNASGVVWGRWAKPEGERREGRVHRGLQVLDQRLGVLDEPA